MVILIGSAAAACQGGPDPGLGLASNSGGHYLLGDAYKVGGHWYRPEVNTHYVKEGEASWYGPRFLGHRTADGERFNSRALTAAHPTLPLPCYVRVTNLENKRSVMVRVNDRGPFASNRIIDVSAATAERLDFKASGTAQVRVEYVGPAPVEGGDERILEASYRGSGRGVGADSSDRVPAARTRPVPRDDLDPQTGPILANNGGWSLLGSGKAHQGDSGDARHAPSARTVQTQLASTSDPRPAGKPDSSALGALIEMSSAAEPTTSGAAKPTRTAKAAPVAMPVVAYAAHRTSRAAAAATALSKGQPVPGPESAPSAPAFAEEDAGQRVGAAHDLFAGSKSSKAALDALASYAMSAH